VTGPPLRQADPSVRAVKAACWGCGFESRREHGCLSVVSDVCCQRSLRLADLSSREVLTSVCVCVSLSVIRCNNNNNNNPLHIKLAGRRGENKKEIKNERLHYTWHTRTIKSIKSNFALYTVSRKPIYLSQDQKLDPIRKKTNNTIQKFTEMQ
jgi:hypothetical protein